MIAKCFQLGDCMCFMIPKRRGGGYLKSCCGYHNINKYGKQLTEELSDKNYIDEGAGAWCDLDGYLSISIKSSYCCYVDKIQAVEVELKDIIMKVFPHVAGFE